VVSRLAAVVVVMSAVCGPVLRASVGDIVLVTVKFGAEVVGPCDVGAVGEAVCTSVVNETTVDVVEVSEELGATLLGKVTTVDIVDGTCEPSDTTEVDETVIDGIGVS